MKKVFVVLGVVWLLMMYASPGLPAQEDQGLQERAKIFWDARVRGDWAVLYEYLPPSSQGGTSRDQFAESGKKKSAFRFLSFEIRKAETAGGLGWVDVVSTAQAVGTTLPPKTTETWEQWEKIDGKWYPIDPKRRGEAPLVPPSLRPAEEEAALKKRVDELWSAKEKEQWGLLYAYCDPEFRKTVSQEEFLQKRPYYIYVDHTVEWAEVNGDLGKARVDYLIRPSDPYLSKAEPLDQTTVEKWVKKDGVWYLLVPEKSSPKEGS